MFLIAGLLLPVVAKADDVNPAWEFTSVGSELNFGGGFSLGEVFVPTQNITVDSLGYFYDPVAGMHEDHAVALYDSSGNQLTSTSISGLSTASSPNFLYNSIAPITLLAGQTYVIEGASGVTDPYAWNDNGFTVYAPINVLGENWDANGGLSVESPGIGTSNGDDGVSDGFWGADFGYEEATPPVPEPSSLLLLGSGLAALAGVIKRKVKA
jgi:hypothetical protein